jgi:hypothetical protein
MTVRYRRGQNPNSHKPKSYSGQRFGMLVFLEPTVKKNKCRSIVWRVRCDCGNVFETPPRYITDAHDQRKHKSDCGCVSAKRRKQVSRYEYKLWLNTKHRASRSGIPFNLEESDIVIPHRCPILDIPLFKSTKGHPDNNSPSLDRVVPELGYVKGNVRVISFRANKLKSNLTIGELERIIAYIRGEI